MQIYLAPMEGLTGYTFRQVYDEFFGGVDKYFTPFLSPRKKKNLRTKDGKEIDPVRNAGRYTVPQILTNRAELFLESLPMLAELGYHEININLGCPSPTVISKKKGSGFLQDPAELDTFLAEIFEVSRPYLITVKTRAGFASREEFPQLLEIYNRYPVGELILHPRAQGENHLPSDWSVYRYALENSRAPVCYNGDIFSVEDYERLLEQFPQTDRVMIGRGVFYDPGLIREIRTGQKTTVEELEAFHDRLFEAYAEALGNETDPVYRLKEVWAYLKRQFPGRDKELKKILKTKNTRDYREAVREIFRQ